MLACLTRGWEWVVHVVEAWASNRHLNVRYVHESLFKLMIWGQRMLSSRPSAHVRRLGLWFRSLHLELEVWR